MGRATIVKNVGNALYQVRLDINQAWIEAKIADLEAKNANYVNDLNEA